MAAQFVSPKQALAARIVVDASRKVPVRVVDGASAPALVGESYHWTNRSGERVRHPSAYSRRGWSSLCYCYSTLRVEVGADWLARATIERDPATGYWEVFVDGESVVCRRAA